MNCRLQAGAGIWLVMTFASPAWAGGLTLAAEELDVDYSYAGKAAVTGSGLAGIASDEHSAGVKYVVMPQVTQDFLVRAGAEWQRFSFGVPTGAPVPATLQQLNAVIGCDYQVGGQWIVRAEVKPGLYSDFAEVTSRDMDARVVLTVVYLANPDLQWLLGLYVDVRSEYPVLPLAGVRWKFADAWTLDFMLPKPRLEYDVNDRNQLFLGADIVAGTFRVGDHFGTDNGLAKLDGQTVDYWEVRFGAGWAWTITQTLQLEAEAGCLAFREFNFFNAATDYRCQAAPYGQFACHARF